MKKQTSNTYTVTYHCEDCDRKVDVKIELDQVPDLADSATRERLVLETNTLHNLDVHLDDFLKGAI